MQNIATIASDGASINGKTDQGALITFNKSMRKSLTEGAPAPCGAITLFDGTGVTASAGAITRQSGAASVKPRIRKSLGREDRGDKGRSFGISRADGRSVPSAYNRSGPAIDGPESDFHARPAAGFYFIPGSDGIRGEYVFKGREP